MFVACILSGLLGIFLPEQATGLVARVLPQFLMIYNFGLVVGGVMGLTGMLHHRKEDVPFSLMIERLSLFFLGSLFVIYGIAIMVTSPSASAGAVTILSVPVVCAWRIYQITRDLRIIHNTLKTPPPPEVKADGP